VYRVSDFLVALLYYKITAFKEVLKVSEQPIHTEIFKGDFGDKTSFSYLAYPKEKEKPVPGVLVIPELWGLTDQTKSRAERLAKLGYAAIAVDIYGSAWVGETSKIAYAAMDDLYANIDRTFDRLMVLLNGLKNHRLVDEKKLVSMGYCLGGALSLHLARKGVELSGVVSFHGNLVPRVVSKGINTKILVCHGGADTTVPDTQVQSFKEEMDSLGADYKFVVYPDALHGFTNPTATEKGKKFNMPIGYNEEADKASWQDMLKFFKEIF